MTKLVKKKLEIKGMHCTSCAISIDFDLEDLKGVKSVKTTYAKEESEIEYDEELLKLDQIFEQIKKTGYSAKVKYN